MYKRETREILGEAAHLLIKALGLELEAFILARYVLRYFTKPSTYKRRL